MAGFNLVHGLLAGKGLALKKGLTGIGIALVVLGGGGGTTPTPADTIGLLSYPVPAGMNRSAASLRTSSGEFVASLWNNRPEAGGSEGIGHIDGRDFKLDALKAGSYVVDLSFHAMVNEYEGGIGNNSFVDLATMDNMWRGYQFMRSGEEIGDFVYVNQHYIEGPSPLVKFLKTAPQKPIQVFTQQGINSGCTLEFMCADSTKLYFAVYDRLGSNVVTYVMAITHGNDQFVTFSGGGSYKANHGTRTDSTLGLLTTNDANNIITGTAVQQTGIAFVKTHDLANKLYVHNKNTGALLQTITSIQRPRACKVDSQDRLWMISATNTVSCYTIGTDGSLTPAGISLSGLVSPANIAIKNGIIYVTDHGSSQQVKAYSETGTLLWTLGSAGGQMTTKDVSATRFYFSDAPLSIDWSSIIPYSNGQFLVVEPGNNRAQLFNADRTPVGGKAGVITYRTVGYECGIDMNDPTRLFWNYQEFKIDYSKPITDCWTLVANWRASAPASHFITTNEQQNIELGRVFNKVYTDSMNGRTYATCQRPSDGVFVEVELASTGLRIVRTDTAPFALYKDGTTCFSRFNGSGYEWNDKARTSFDSNGNRVMSATTTAIRLSSTLDTDPFDWSGFPNADADLRTSDGHRYIYQTNLVRDLAGKRYGLGYHLGEVKPGSNAFTKRLNPSTGDQEYAGGQPTDGYYDTGDHLYQNDARPDLAPGPQVGYGGAGIRIAGRWVFEKVYGEFYRGGQQNESFMWHAPTGQMVLHYGVNSDEVRAWQTATGRRIYPGMSGGVQRHEVNFHPTNDDIIYEWHGEEGGSGMLNRWKTSGVNTFTVQSLPAFLVTSTTTYAKRWGATATDLLAKVPKRGSLSQAGTGWTQSRPDDYTNKFGGGPYGAGRCGIKTYRRTESNGFYLRYRSNVAGDSMWWRSEVFTNPTPSKGYTLRLTENYEDGNSNSNELGQANSGGLYRHFKDSTGKILIRTYVKSTGGNNVAIMANNKVLVSGSASELTDLWRKIRTYQDWIITVSDSGVATIKWSTFNAVTLDGPFEAGASFKDTSFSLEYLAWNNGASLDRVVALGKAFFIPLS